MSTIVIDTGSASTRMGKSDGSPISFDTCVGRPKSSAHLLESVFVGQEAIKRRGILTLKYPMTDFPSNWDDIEALWVHGFGLLNSNPSEHNVLLTNDAYYSASKQPREKMAEIIFEKFNGKGLYIEDQSVLSLFSSGRTTGIVLNSGVHVTRAVPILEGNILYDALLGVPLAGSDITIELSKLITEKEGMTKNLNKNLLEDIKQRYCFVANKNQNSSFSETIKHEEETFQINQEKYKAPEKLFYSEEGSAQIHQLVNRVILRCNPEVRKELYSNIVLAGGNTRFPGIQERLTQEIIKITTPETNVVVVNNNDHYSAWEGGKIVSNLPNFQSMAISATEFNEFGPTIVHSKLSQNK